LQPVQNALCAVVEITTDALEDDVRLELADDGLEPAKLARQVIIKNGRSMVSIMNSLASSVSSSKRLSALAGSNGIGGTTAGRMVGKPGGCGVRRHNRRRFLDPPVAIADSGKNGFWSAGIEVSSLV
jgi:hypothetical protein